MTFPKRLRRFDFDGYSVVVNEIAVRDGGLGCRDFSLLVLVSNRCVVADAQEASPPRLEFIGRPDRLVAGQEWTPVEEDALVAAIFIARRHFAIDRLQQHPIPSHHPSAFHFRFQSVDPMVKYWPQQFAALGAAMQQIPMMMRYVGSENPFVR